MPARKTAAAPATDAATATRAKPSRRPRAQAAPTLSPAEVGHDAALLEEIRTEAYLIWLNEGQPHGRDALHWAQAEEVVRTRLRPALIAAE